MASYKKLHQVFLVIFLFTCSIAFFNVEARESMFFSKMNPVRRYSQFVSSSMQAVAPVAAEVATPAPAPAPTSSEVEPASENYVYGFYDREVGEFPISTTKEEATAVRKTSGAEDEYEFANNDAGFGSQDENERYTSKFNNYEDEYTSTDNEEVNQYPEVHPSYRRNNNNVHNSKYARSYDDSMYTTNYSTEDDNNDRYTDESQYYTDKFERVKPSRRYYNGNGDGYYRENESSNEYNHMEEYEGVYQP